MDTQTSTISTLMDRASMNSKLEGNYCYRDTSMIRLPKMQHQLFSEAFENSSDKEETRSTQD